MAAGMLAAHPGVTELDAHLTVVPPGPVTDRVRVEARLALRNDGDADRSFTVRMGIGPPSADAPGKEVRVPAGEAALVTDWFGTNSLRGNQRVWCTAQKQGRPVVRRDWSLEVIPCQTRALPMLQGLWVDLLGLSNGVYPHNREAVEQDLRDAVGAMKTLAVSVIILTYVEYQGRFFYPSRLRFHDRDMGREASGEWFPFDAVEAVLSEADARGMHVMLGLGRSGDTHLLWGGLRDAQRLEHAVRVSCSVAAELWERYGHHPSLYGWYLTHEMADLEAASAYYDPVADFCHDLAPDRPVMVAPAGTPVITPESLRRSRVDIFAYQDAVGAGYVPGAYTYDPERRLAHLDELFARYRGWHQDTDKHLWGDLELWEMQGPEYANPYAAPLRRVLRQIRLQAPHVDMITGYEFLCCLQPPSMPWRLLDPRAAELWEGYARYARGWGLPGAAP